jgi:hypothetical protein
MELFANNPLGQMAMSTRQLERMKEIMTRLRALVGGPDGDAADAGDA